MAIKDINDSEGMFKVYKSGYEMTMKDIAGYANDIANVPIWEFKTFGTRNHAVMMHFMAVNIREYYKRLFMSGNSVPIDGNSENFSNDIRYYTYSAPINYAKFSREVKIAEKEGIASTRTSSLGIRKRDYDESRSLYRNDENLYPDDNGIGTFFNKWDVDDEKVKDSILAKTKRAFNNRQINSLISRFSTNSDVGSSNVVGSLDAQSMHGLSRGRNLLTKKSEDSTSTYDINGYKNPYCRVWTHHYQLDRLYKNMRPFSMLNDDGTYSGESRELKDLHNWGDNFKTENGEYGWKTGLERWNKSVMDRTTNQVNITPSYNGGGKMNIHTKQCMFSIENLAWRDYDPYTFEKNLSWEQRGPMGGRIMWFPPYNITFNEVSNATWSSHTFIGRGENVYTYSNTERRGTLSFTLLVDHPSVTDYLSWYDNTETHDTDLMRYFAGCDSANPKDSNSVLSAVRPTPLTDEGIDTNNSNNDNETEDGLSNENVEKIIFYVFFPNNYSGCYDKPTASYGTEHEVDAIAYLLSGVGAQKKFDENSTNNTMDLITENVTDFRKCGNGVPVGYEMGNSSTLTDDNYIYGHALSSKEDPNTHKIIYKSDIKWESKDKKYNMCGQKFRYRMDGEYVFPNTDEEKLVNTWSQKLDEINLKDNNDFKLNCDIDNIKNKNLESDVDSLYSFSDVAYALSTIDGWSDESQEYLKTKSTDEKKEKLVNLFTNFKIKSIETDGFANSHGYLEKNKKLAINRAKTINKWLLEVFKSGIGVNKINNSSDIIAESKYEVITIDNNIGDISVLDSKIYRSAKCVITFNNTETKSLTDVDNTVKKEEPNLAQQNAVKDEEKQRQTEISGFTFFKEENGIKFYKKNYNPYEDDEYSNKKKKRKGKKKKEEKEELWINKNGEMVKLKNTKTLMTDSISGSVNVEKEEEDYNTNGRFNKIRYDQEYHFFKKVENEHPEIWSKIMDKIKYFDPAFHSMTPEGFNARLTFLHQCTRQGATNTMSDTNGTTSNNLAFGRPPFCVLRFGDFFNQLVIINSVDFNYDVDNGPLWDLNPEGAGVQPLMCKVNMQITFIGGGDIEGPVRRLQNAMSFNYYANTSLYDNRADRPKYDTDYSTMKDELDKENSYSYTSKIKENIKSE